jgi:hypothetical protein
MTRNTEVVIISGKYEVFNRWKEYFSELHNEDMEGNMQECKGVHISHQLVSCPRKGEVLQPIQA